jgi:hypothetical protein
LLLWFSAILFIFRQFYSFFGDFIHFLAKICAFLEKPMLQLKTIGPLFQNLFFPLARFKPRPDTSTVMAKRLLARALGMPSIAGKRPDGERTKRGAARSK